MPECLKEFMVEALRLAPVLFLSVLGGVVAQINRPREQFSWWWLLVGIIVAAFVGLVVHLLLQSTSFPPGIKGAACAISGYASRDVLSILKKRFLRSLKKEIG